MLSKNNRLSTHTVAELFKKGKRYSSPFFILLYKEDEDPQAFNATVVVSKKVAKKSVTRTFIRRRVYSIIQSYKDRIEGVHLAVVVKKDISNTEFSMVQDELSGLLDKLL